jgi:hypothetical protein
MLSWHIYSWNINLTVPVKTVFLSPSIVKLFASLIDPIHSEVHRPTNDIPLENNKMKKATSVLDDEKHEASKRG